MGSNLSHELLDAEFLCAFGTVEYIRGYKYYVGRGTSLTYDTNNGVLAVYDEEGRPWVTKFVNPHKNDPTVISGSDEWLGRLCKEYRLRRGAHVPHSNDGGRFMNSILPNLQNLPLITVPL